MSVERANQLAEKVLQYGLCPSADSCDPPNPEVADCQGCIAGWAALAELQALAARATQAEEAVVTLGRAAAFYADFEESGQDWSIAMGACERVYGRIPMVDEGGDPDCYRLPARAAVGEAAAASPSGEPG